jgi:hypothetical protein
MSETRSLSLRDLIEHELQHHEACLPTPGTVAACRSEQTVGFHRGLHWVLDALRAQEPPQAQKATALRLLSDLTVLDVEYEHKRHALMIELESLWE